MKRIIFKNFVVAILMMTFFSAFGNPSNQLILDGKKYEPCSENKYQGNMIMVVQVMQQGNVVLDCEVAVFDSNEECRASELSQPDDNGLVYLTVQGEGAGEVMHFRVVYDNEGTEEDVLFGKTVTYVNDDVIGSFSDPFILDLDDLDSIEDLYGENVEIRSTKGGLLISVDKKRNVSVYNIMGVCVFSQDVEGDCNITLPQGAYIVDGKKFFVR